MNFQSLTFTLLAIFLFLISPVGFSFTSCIVKDDDQHIIQLSKPAQRIISLAPDLTEDLFAIGAGKQLVGVLEGSDYPAAAQHLPRVGSYQGLDLERIINLHPDLIIVWGKTFSRPIEVLKKFGIAVYIAEPHQLADIPRTLQHLGCLTDTRKSAQQLSQHFAQQITELRAHYATQKPIRVFYQIGGYSLFTVNHTSWIDQVITLCGGINVFANAHLIAPEVSWEAVVAANPEVIINDSANVTWQTAWKRFPTITAVKHSAFITINPDWLERPGPRLLEGTKYICNAMFLIKKRS